MLSYPLCPFFILFCNVITTSNQGDFTLMQDITNGLSAFSGSTKYFARLYRLLSFLTRLSEPLVQLKSMVVPQLTSPEGHANIEYIQHWTSKRTHRQSVNTIHRSSSDGNAYPTWDNPTHWQTDDNLEGQCGLPFTIPPAGYAGDRSTPGEHSSLPWDDSRLLELFQTQPTLNWFDANVFCQSHEAYGL